MLARRLFLNPRFQTIYSRGGTIFYRIEIWGNDIQGLDLLASPSSITVLLTQEVECRTTAGKPSRPTIVKAATEVDVRAVAQGVSWPVASLPEEDIGDVRILEGEVNVPQRLSSNADVGLLQLNVSALAANCVHQWESLIIIFPVFGHICCQCSRICPTRSKQCDRTISNSSCISSCYRHQACLAHTSRI